MNSFKLFSSLRHAIFFATGSILIPTLGIASDSSVSPPDITSSLFSIEHTPPTESNTPEHFQLGAERFNEYLNLLTNKSVALVANNTTVIGENHLLDLLLQKGVTIAAIMPPEHGFRGQAAAGEKVDSSVDASTGIPIRSLYGDNLKPSAESLQDVDTILFDLQDVGVRFYTYTSTLRYVIEAAMELGKEVIVLDRPNPNGDYVAGPILDTKSFSSFVGLSPTPLVHGLTIGEFANMIVGEQWHEAKVQHEDFKLTVIPMKGYTHQTVYVPPISPSPNLPTYQSIRLYPSLALFEATEVSIGRGTPFPFEIIGYPNKDLRLENLDGKAPSFTFTAESLPGFAINPPQEGLLSYGEDLRNTPAPHFTLKYFLTWNKALAEQDITMLTRPEWLNKLMGTEDLTQVLQEQDFSRKDIVLKNIAQDLEKLWAPELQSFITLRKEYLLYPDNAY